MFVLYPSIITAADKTGDEVVWQGISAFYNEEFDEAVEVLTKARNDFPEHPTVHLVWAVSLWLRAQAKDGYKVAHTALEKSSAEIIPVYQQLLKKYPRDPDYQLNMATTQGLLARVALGKKDWLGVVSSGIKGYKGARAVHQNHPEIYDSYLPLGVLNYYVGRSSSAVQVLGNIFGIEANSDIGLQQINLAVEKGEYARVEATSILAYIYLWIQDDPQLALIYCDKLRSEFPKSAYYHHIYTEALLQLKRLDEAEMSLAVTQKMADDNLPASKKAWQPTLKYQRALLNFHLGDLDEALKLVSASINDFNAELDTPLGYGYLLRGMIYDLKGNRRKAIANYQAAVKLENYTTAVTKAKRYLKEPYQK
jgi:predicted negative regulator of RcsB-dependent stress response